MDRETSLRLAPIFRGISIVLIVLTFATWLFPYFNYDADKEFGIDISKGPLRFVPVDGAYYDWDAGEFHGTFETVNMIYRGSDTLKTQDGKYEIKDYPDVFSLWQYVLMSYNYPQLLAKRIYEGASSVIAGDYVLPAGVDSEANVREITMLANRFYKPDGTMVPLRDIKTADIDHSYVTIMPRFIKMWFIAPMLIQILTGLFGLIICIKKRGIGTQVFPLIFGIAGVAGSLGNRILLSYSPEYTYAYILQFVMSCLVLVNAVAGLVIQAIELKGRPKEYYLPLG